MPKMSYYAEMGADEPNKNANEDVAMKYEEANKDTLDVKMIDSTVKSMPMDTSGLSTGMRDQGLQ